MIAIDHNIDIEYCNMNSKSSNIRPSGSSGRNRKHLAAISTMGRGLILLGIATTSTSVDAFTSTPSAVTTQLRCNSALQYRYGNDDDQPIDVLSAIRRRRRSHHMSSRPPSTTSTPSPPPTVELEQELDDYIEYLDRRYTRIHPKRSSSSIGRLGLSNLASSKLRQRLHVMSTSSSSSLSSALVFTSYMRQVSDKFISSIKSMTNFLSINQVMASVFSVTSLVALLLVRPLLFGTFRQG